MSVDKMRKPNVGKIISIDPRVWEHDAIYEMDFEIEYNGGTLKATFFENHLLGILYENIPSYIGMPMAFEVQYFELFDFKYSTIPEKRIEIIAGNQYKISGQMVSPQPDDAILDCGLLIECDPPIPFEKDKYYECKGGWFQVSDVEFRENN